MDVRFTNVLEGARQYFQGLPTGTNSMVSHPYPSESHQQRNEHEQNREPPPGSGSYWPSQHPETGQKLTSHPGDASRPPSHPEYAQNIPNEHNIPHYSGSFQDQYQPQQQLQNFQFPRPHSREAPSNNAPYQSHIPSSSPYQQIPSPSVKSQTASMQYQSLSSTYTSNPASVAKTSSTVQQYQTNIPKSNPYESHSATIKPTASSQYQPNNSPYFQPHSPNVKPPQSHPSYLYNQPHSPTIKPPPSTQYQSHIPSNSPYHQSPSPTVKQYHQAPSPYQQPPSPYHQSPSPQLPRVPSREQQTPRVPSREQPLSRVPSQEHIGPPEGYNSYSQQRSYYSGQQTQPVKSSSNSGTYKVAPPSQPYPAASQQNNVYYKHIYTKQPQTQQQIPYSSSRPEIEQVIHNSEQAYRATRNLPPIAAVSNYHSSHSVREIARPPNTTLNHNKTFSSSTYTSPSPSSVVTNNSSSIIQHTPNRTLYNPTITTSNYQDYITNTTQCQSQFQYNTTAISTHASSQVVTTCSNSSSSYYATVNQNQSSSQHYYQQESKSDGTRAQPSDSHQTPTISSNITDHNLNGRLMSKRESPLDLSVKTVRTPADSTLGDADNDGRNKLTYHTSRHTSISTNNYPQLDVNSIHRNLTQRTGQLPTATAPKVEFRPNFNVPSLIQARPPQKRPADELKKGLMPERAHSNNRPSYESKNLYQNTNSSRYMSVTVPSAAHVNSFIQAQGAASNTSSSGTPRMPVPNYKSSVYGISNQDTQKKRPADVPISAIPPKQSKVDNWRQSIDLQIEDRLSSYQQQQAKVSTGNKTTTINGGYASQDRPREIYSSYQKPNYENAAKQTFNMQAPYQAATSHSQTYVPSPMTHQYLSYNVFPPQSSQTGNSYLQPSSRSSSAVSLNTLTNSKHNLGGAVDKRTLSILKNSIEVKGRKKLEQQKSHEHYMQQPRPDVQHPSTDVTAPLQPKPGLTGRNNISPFTPTSFPDNTNMHKFHIPKAIDSINFDSNKNLNPTLEKSTHDTVIANHSSSNAEFDGLAAFLAARIRTKGELKQVGNTAHSMSMSTNISTEEHHQAIDEDQMKSPNRQEYISQTSTSGSTVNTSPPKTLKERQAFAPRKRLFSRNDEEPSNCLPARDKSGLRSSSETSVFDFPDSDSENDIGGRESLEAMRKGRRSSKQSSAPLIDNKPESPVRPASTDDDLFAQLCNNFVEQLRDNPLRKKIKCNKDVTMDSEIPVNRENSSEEKHVETNITIKAEKVEKCDEIETLEIKEDVQEKEDIIKITEIKEEPKGTTVENTDNIISPDVILKLEEQELKLDLRKEDDPVFVSKKQSVRRRLISSSDSERDDESKENKVESNIKSELKDTPAISDTELIKDESCIDSKLLESPSKASELLPFIRPAKKPSFGDGSDFYPGWEEGVYKYKKALRMPPSLIQVSRPPQFHRLSTSLPDLDPYPQSPTTSIPPETEKESSTKSKIKKGRSEFTDSDNESNSSFNLFSRKTNYDSEGSASVRSLPNTAKEMSILDRLLQKCGGKKKRKYKRKDDHSPKIVPKAESAVELLPTPSLEIKEEKKEKEIKKLSSSPVIKSESALLGFSKRTINNFKDAFIKKQNNILGVNEQFTTVVFQSRTRKETRVLKQRATIKEVFGEDRPASAPPVTCVNDLQQIKGHIIDDSSKLGNLVIKLEKQNAIIEKVKESQKEDVTLDKVKEEVSVDKDKEDDEQKDTKQVLKNKFLIKGKKKENNISKALADKNIKSEVAEDKKDVKAKLEEVDQSLDVNQSVEDVNRNLDEANQSLEEITIKRDPDEKSETLSIDGDEGSTSNKKRTKFGKMRRKLSSGFDYIRKKKKVKKENNEIENVEKKKRKNIVTKAPESIDDIQKEIKSWVLNKGIGETHLHRAARLGYTDVMAYCLENLQTNASPKDNAGYTPLHVACSRGHLEIAKLLLLYGANPSESAQGGIRPLHEAVENGFVEITRLLLSYGADPTLATYSGMTPLALTNDEVTKQFLKNHLDDIEGEVSEKWELFGPSDIFDPVDKIGYNVLDNTPEPDPESEEEDIDFEVSEQLLPNVYTLRGEPPSERWVLLQDLSNILKIKSRDALLRQICPPSTSSANISYKSVMRELKMSDFLEQAHCCQFLNAGEKINTRASKIALVKYTDKVKELLGIENVLIEGR